MGVSGVRHATDKRDMLYEVVGARLKRLRQVRGIPVEDVMRAAGLSRGTLQKVEDGLACPIHTVAVLADFYGVSISDIVPNLRELAA